jgi:hypothetical protein
MMDRVPDAVMREPLHRLNRLEYNNTVRDLLGVSLRPADSFPVDSSSDSAFDNAAQGLSLNSALFRLYFDSANDLMHAAFDTAPSFSWHRMAKDVADAGGSSAGDGWSVEGHEIEFHLTVPQAETVTVSVVAKGENGTGRAPVPVMGFRVDQNPMTKFTVQGLLPQPYKTPPMQVTAGDHTVRITLDNYTNDPGRGFTNSLILYDIDISSGDQQVPASRRKIESCDPATASDQDACYSQIITRLARRAWRRPITAEESARLVGLWQSLSAGEGKETALQLTIRTLLFSPEFLYRSSVADPRAPGAKLAPLAPATLASRLSYFLWSSMPDDAMLDAAEKGQLASDDELTQTVGRMLADSKASGLLDGFVDQWLDGRKLAIAAPSAQVYPNFDERLRSAMQGESKLFFGDFLTHQVPLSSLLNPNFAFVNDRLAQHYGYPLPGSDKLTRVALPDSGRGGLLMQGTWLTATSDPLRTSPVRRGKWLMQQILCIDVPAPPPGVPPFPEVKGDATVRQRLQMHRADAKCAGCHNLLDPLGLGLEQFDGIGAERTMENGLPIDTSGAVPEGNAFVGGRELAQQLVADPRFYRCLTGKLMSYGVGRKLDDSDQPFVDQVSATANEATLPDLLRRIVLSPVFRSVSAN